MNYIITGLAIIAIFCAWKYMWQRTLLDTTRDRLFDLRDEARAWFLKNGYSLSHPVHIALREMLNCHLRHTERVSLTSYAAYALSKQSFRQQEAYLEKQIEADFATEDEKIYKYVSRVREVAGFVLIDHIIKNNLFLTIVCYSLAATCFCVAVLRDALKKIVTPSSMSKRFHPAMASAMVAFVSLLSPGQISNIRMEKYSLTQTANQCETPFVHRCKHTA